MTTALAPTTEAKVQSYATFSFGCDVKLSDTEKIIIDVPVTTWDTTTNKYATVTEKVQLEELHYNNRDEVVSLTTIVYRRFRKDGALRFRTNYLSMALIPQVIAQIPDHYHDYARKEFAKEMKELQDQINKTANNGVKI